MYLTLRLAAFAAFLAAFAALAQTPAANSDITDLAYSVQAEDSIYFTGKYQGKPVHLVRNGMIGAGKWTIYSGATTNRVRLTLDDRKGLQEILAMDTGQRMTLKQVGEERIEYRLYAPDRKFIIGSVLYRNKGRWLQGIMMTEAFAGYPALADVADVSKKFRAQAALPTAIFAAWLNDRWHNLNLIPLASAQDGNSQLGQVKRIFTVTKDFLDGPVAREMMKAQLVGVVAFTMKLVEAGGGMAVLIDVVGGAPAVATALPMLQAAVAGYGVVAAASKAYEVGDKFYLRVSKARNLGSSTSVQDFFEKLLGSCKSCGEAPPEPPEAQDQTQATLAKSQNKDAPRPANAMKTLAEMSAMMDAEEFREELELAGACARNRDFACAENHLKKAGKLAGSATDIQLLAEALGNTSRQRESVAEETRMRAAADRQRADNAALAEQRRVQEEQRVVQAARQQQQQAASGSGGGLLGGFAGAFAKNLTGQVLGQARVSDNASMRALAKGIDLSEQMDQAQASPSQQQGGGIADALTKNLTGQVIGQARGSGSASMQALVKGFDLGEQMDQAQASPSQPPPPGGGGSGIGGGPIGVGGSGCCSNANERIADNRTRGAPDNFETNNEKICIQTYKNDMRSAYCQAGVTERKRSLGGLEKFGRPNPSASSTGGGSTGDKCGMSNYAGPQDDPQFWTLCATAYSYQCNGDSTSAAKTCAILDASLKNLGNKTAKGYCPKYCN